MPKDPNVAVGSKAALTAPKRDFWFTPNNGRHQTGPVGPVRARRRHGYLCLVMVYSITFSV
jgi:hypothetical protein